MINQEKSNKWRLPILKKYNLLTLIWLTNNFLSFSMHYLKNTHWFNIKTSKKEELLLQQLNLDLKMLQILNIDSKSIQILRKHLKYIGHLRPLEAYSNKKGRQIFGWLTSKNKKTHHSWYNYWRLVCPMSLYPRSAEKTQKLFSFPCTSWSKKRPSDELLWNNKITNGSLNSLE